MHKYSIQSQTIKEQHPTTVEHPTYNEDGSFLGVSGSSVDLLTGVSRYHPDGTSGHQILDCPPCK